MELKHCCRLLGDAAESARAMNRCHVAGALMMSTYRWTTAGSLDGIICSNIVGWRLVARGLRGDVGSCRLRVRWMGRWSEPNMYCMTLCCETCLRQLGDTRKWSMRDLVISASSCGWVCEDSGSGGGSVGFGGGCCCCRCALLSFLVRFFFVM